MSLRAKFPNAQFSPPATEQSIAETESALGITLPEGLRNFYLECDGFREDRGNAKYLFSLVEDDYVGSLVTMTRYYWNEFNVPNFKPFVFFGSSSGDDCWGLNWQHPHEIIAYHHHMGDQYEMVGSNIVEVWKADYALYDEIDQSVVPDDEN